MRLRLRPGRGLKAQLERGARMVELLKQGQYQPFPVEEQVVSIWAGTTGKLDDVPVAEIRRFEREFLDYVRLQHKDLLAGIVETGLLADGTVDALAAAIGEFKQGYQTADGKLLSEQA